MKAGTAGHCRLSLAAGMNTHSTDTSRALLPGMVLNNRYEIKRLLSYTPHHGVYLAKDVKITGRNWLIKEFIPEGITGEELARREEAYNATLEVILNFEHAAFPVILDSFSSLGRWYMVTESIDGLTLRSVASMSIEPLKESQILEWALQVCDALLYLHSRPKPFIGSLLDPDHIMVVMGDESEQIRLVNLGMNRFFDPSLAARAFSTSLVDLAHDFYELGKTLYFLFSRTEYTPDRLLRGIPGASDPTSRILTRLLSEEPQRNYRDASELRRDFDRILHPPKPQVQEEEVKPEKALLPFNFLIPSKENVDRAVFAVLSQKVTVFFAEVITIVILAVLLVICSRPGWNYTRYGPVVYCACHGELYTYDAASGRLLDRRNQEGPVKSITHIRDEGLLYLLDYGRGLIHMMEILHNTPGNTAIKTDIAPVAMDLYNPFIYVLNEKSANISVISLKEKALVSILPTESDCRYMAFSPARNLIYVSNTSADSVQVIDPRNPGASTTAHFICGAGPLALSLDEKTLYVANTRSDGLTIMDAEAFKITGETRAQGLRKPVAMKVSAGKNELYILDFEEHSLHRFSLGTSDTEAGAGALKEESVIRVGKNPMDMTVDGAGRLWVSNYGSHNIAVVNPVTGMTETYINTGRNPEAILFVP